MQGEPRTTRERSPLAIISLLIAILLFGLFWLWQKETIQQQSNSSSLTQINTTTLAREEPIPSFLQLEASAVNIPIPDFSSAF